MMVMEWIEGYDLRRLLVPTMLSWLPLPNRIAQMRFCGWCVITRNLKTLKSLVLLEQPKTQSLKFAIVHTGTQLTLHQWIRYLLVCVRRSIWTWKLRKLPKTALQWNLQLKVKH